MKPLPLTTPWQQHKIDWLGCTKCDLHKTRGSVCLVRGSLPCDILFVGEAPGVNEDSLGKPFVGPAGRLLNDMIARSVPDTMKTAFTNLVGCLPWEDGEKREPTDEQIKACSPRLTELVRLANPKLIVCVGKLAGDWLATPLSRDTLKLNKEYKKVTVIHPAAILRGNPASKGILFNRNVIAIRGAVAGLGKTTN